MSQENVEVVRRLYAISLAGEDLAASFDQCVREGLLAPNFEWRGGPRGGRAVAGMENTVGRDEYLEMMHRFSEDFEDLTSQLEQLIDAGDDRVVAITRSSARGKLSGAPVEMVMAHVHWLEARRIVRVDSFLEPREALEAVGLRQ
jgi:ketosteroid isomerase-like protein